MRACISFWYHKKNRGEGTHMERKTLKNTLIGCFEIFIFMRSAIDRFSDKCEDALKSFLFPVVLYPFSATTFYITQGHPGLGLMLTHGLIAWGGFLLSYLMLYAITRMIKRDQYFWQTINILNSASILGFFLMLPIYIPVLLLETSMQSLTNVWVFVILAGLAYSSWVLAHSLRLNLPLGAFLATLNLFISDMGFKLLMQLGAHATSPL